MAQKADEAAVKAAKALLERAFPLGELTPTKAKGSKANSRQARRDFLERLRMVHGISAPLQTKWHDFCEWYVDWIVRPAMKGSGPSRMKDLEARLASSAMKAKSQSKVSNAFDIWVRETIRDNMPSLAAGTSIKI